MTITLRPEPATYLDFWSALRTQMRALGMLWNPGYVKKTKVAIFKDKQLRRIRRADVNAENWEGILKVAKEGNLQVLKVVCEHIFIEG